MSKILLAFCTCPDAATAERIAQTLVAERLAACVNQLPGVRSIYMWQGQVQADAEVLLLIKTDEGRFDSLSERLKELHPYELPELIAIPVEAGSEPYLDWVRQSVATSNNKT